MSQSELIEKVAQATELNQAAEGRVVKAVVNAILDDLWPAKRSVSPALAFSMWRRGPHARDGIHKPEKPSKSQPARQCGSTQARLSKMPSIRLLERGLPGSSPHHERNPRSGSKRPVDVREGRDRGKCFRLRRLAELGTWYGRHSVGIVKAQWRRDDDPSDLVVLDPFKHSALVHLPIVPDLADVAHRGAGDTVLLQMAKGEGFEPPMPLATESVLPRTTQCSMRIVSPVSRLDHRAISPAAQIPGVLVST